MRGKSKESGRRPRGVGRDGEGGRKLLRRGSGSRRGILDADPPRGNGKGAAAELGVVRALVAAAGVRLFVLLVLSVLRKLPCVLGGAAVLCTCPNLRIRRNLRKVRELMQYRAMLCAKQAQGGGDRDEETAEGAVDGAHGSHG